MTENAIVLNISEMIDLAIGTPEVGVVDFNMLQTVLHCLAQQMHVLGKNVEVRGSLVALPISRDNVQTIAITEFSVDTDNNETKTPKALPPAQTDDSTILVVERVKKTDSPSPVQPNTPTPGLAPSATSPGLQTGGPGVAPPVTGTATQEKLSLVTVSKFNVLENTVEDLKNRVYGSMPKNEEILEKVRSQTNIKAIQDMWTNLNVSSRLEAAEAGIGKLSSLVQDLINETTELQKRETQPGGAGFGVEKTAAGGAHPGGGPVDSSDASGGGGGGGTGGGTASGGTAGGGTAGGGATGGGTAGDGTAGGGTAGGGTVGGGTAGGGTAGGGATGGGAVSGVNIGSAGVGGGISSESRLAASYDDVANLRAFVNRLQGDLDQLTQTFYSTMKEIQTGIEPSPLALPLSTHAAALDEIQSPSAPSSDRGGRGYSGTNKELLDRVNDIERRLRECCETIGKNEGTLTDQFNSMQDQLEYLSKQVANLSPNPNNLMVSGSLSPDLIKDLQGLMQLFQTVQGMQEQLKKVHDTALQLAAEKDDRQSHVNALLEQIELLKTIKLDREDMTEAMADKADLRMLARKVSQDQFEMACNDLSRGLEHTIGKLNVQESLWQQALDDIQREIETKLDKMELSPVKDFFNSKLKQLQENLKQMASLRREAEAAGSKKKLLRDVNCLSCDANAVMAMEAPSALPAMPPLPATMSMKPYLSYELDLIRKTQASNLPQRNMHDWENIDKQMVQPSKPQRVRSGTDKHLCNRYCGGSHTTTTAAQRVVRLGHFVKQWGPDVLPLSSGLAAGDDGRMYRVSPPEGANVGPGGAVDTTCTPKSPKRADIPRDTPISEECRCLEAQPVTNNHKQ